MKKLFLASLGALCLGGSVAAQEPYPARAMEDLALANLRQFSKDRMLLTPIPA